MQTTSLTEIAETTIAAASITHGLQQEPEKSPIVIFEWELTPEERLNEERARDIADRGMTDSDIDELDAPTETPLRWFGSIEAHLGYAQGEFPHTFEAWCELLHPDDLLRVLDAIERHLENGEFYTLSSRARRHDGSWLQFTQSGVATRDSKGTPWKLTGTLCDFVTPEDNQAQNGTNQLIPKEQQEKARAESLLRTASYLNAQLDLDDVCQAICEEAGRTIGAPSAVMLFNKSQDAFVPAAVRDMPQDYDKRYTPTMRSIYDQHVAQWGPLFLFTDAQSTLDLPNHKLYCEVNMRTIGIASLIREGEVLGLLKVYSFGETRSFDENELALLQGLADLGAQAIANARLYAESQRRLANIQSLRQIDMAILGSSDVNLSLSVVLDQTVSRLEVDAASILLLNARTNTLRYAGGRGFRAATPRRTDWRLGEGLAGRAALERHLIYVPDLSQPDVVVSVDSTDPALKLPEADPTRQISTYELPKHAEPKPAPSRRSGVLINENFISYYAVPLEVGGQVKGVLEIWHRSSLRLDEEKLEFLETLAGQAAIAVDNASLLRDVQRSNDELMLAYDSTLEGWSRALDLRDKETEGHSQRVTSEAIRLAESMGLDDGALLQIRRGALLHDIGKMGIPDTVLLKPGPLTDDEWVEMKKHPSYALELLSPIGYLRPALEIPYSHHEKWDGTGYPLGLSGQQIPLSARIFAVVDVWDALCSDRPYRKGWPLNRVLKHIRSGSGTHFDPQVVQAFLRNHPPIQEEEDEPQNSSSNSSPPPTSTTAIGPIPANGSTSPSVTSSGLTSHSPAVNQARQGFFANVLRWLSGEKTTS